MNIDTIIFENRKKLNLSQVDLAEKLGVSGKTVSRWEKGISTPDIYSLKKDVRGFEYTNEYFL